MASDDGDGSGGGPGLASLLNPFERPPPKSDGPAPRSVKWCLWHVLATHAPFARGASMKELLAADSPLLELAPSLRSCKNPDGQVSGEFSNDKGTHFRRIQAPGEPVRYAAKAGAAGAGKAANAAAPASGGKQTPQAPRRASGGGKAPGSGGKAAGGSKTPGSGGKGGSGSKATAGGKPSATRKAAGGGGATPPAALPAQPVAPGNTSGAPWQDATCELLAERLPGTAAAVWRGDHGYCNARIERVLADGELLLLCVKGSAPGTESWLQPLEFGVSGKGATTFTTVHQYRLYRHDAQLGRHVPITEPEAAAATPGGQQPAAAALERSPPPAQPAATPAAASKAVAAPDSAAAVKTADTAQAAAAGREAAQRRAAAGTSATTLSGSKGGSSSGHAVGQAGGGTARWWQQAVTGERDMSSPREPAQGQPSSEERSVQLRRSPPAQREAQQRVPQSQSRQQSEELQQPKQASQVQQGVAEPSPPPANQQQAAAAAAPPAQQQDAAAVSPPPAKQQQAAAAAPPAQQQDAAAVSPTSAEQRQAAAATPPAQEQGVAEPSPPPANQQQAAAAAPPAQQQDAAAVSPPHAKRLPPEHKRQPAAAVPAAGGEQQKSAVREVEQASPQQLPPPPPQKQHRAPRQEPAACAQGKVQGGKKRGREAEAAEAAPAQPPAAPTGKRPAQTSTEPPGKPPPAKPPATKVPFSIPKRAVTEQPPKAAATGKPGTPAATPTPFRIPKTAHAATPTPAPAAAAAERPGGSGGGAKRPRMAAETPPPSASDRAWPEKQRRPDATAAAPGQLTPAAAWRVPPPPAREPLHQTLLHACTKAPLLASAARLEVSWARPAALPAAAPDRAAAHPAWQALAQRLAAAGCAALPAWTPVPQLPDSVRHGRIFISKRETLSACMERGLFVSNSPLDVEGLQQGMLALMHSLDERAVYGCFQVVAFGTDLDPSFPVPGYRHHVRVRPLRLFEPVPADRLEAFCERKVNRSGELTKFFDKHLSQKQCRQVWALLSHYDGRLVQERDIPQAFGRAFDWGWRAAKAAAAARA